MAEESGAGKLLAGAAVGGGVVARISTLRASRPATAAPTSEKLDYLIDLQTATVGQLLRLVELGEQLIGNIPIAQQQVSVPLSPEVLNRIITSNRMELTGKVGVMHYQYAVLCPAGVTTVFANIVPLGWVGIHVEGTNVDFSLYDEDILFTLMLTGEIVSNRTPCASNLVLVSELYRPVHEGSQIVMTVENNSLLDTVAMPEFFVLYLEKSFYESFYLPIIRKAYQAYLGIAEAP